MSAGDRLAQQLGSSLNAPGNGAVFHAILILLSEGAPVPKAAVARALGRLEKDAAGLLARIPSLEFDDAGDIVGAGLSLRPTAHIFEIGGKQLYTWCALDTLIFPAMLGRTARVTSPCAATGAPVRLVVGPEGIGNLAPASAVVSLHLFEGTRDVRNAFCRDVNFFASEDAAAAWLHTHPDGWASMAGIHSAEPKACFWVAGRSLPTSTTRRTSGARVDAPRDALDRTVAT